MEDVICAAEAGSHLIAPAELHGGEAGGIEGGLRFLVHADSEVEGQTAAHLPAVLEVERLSGLLIGTGVDHAVADDEVSVATLADGLPKFAICSPR